MGSWDTSGSTSISDEKIPKSNSAAQVCSKIGFREPRPENVNFSSESMFERIKKSKVTNALHSL